MNKKLFCRKCKQFEMHDSESQRKIERLEEQVRLTEVYWKNEAKAAFGAGIRHGQNLDGSPEVWTQEAYEKWRKNRIKNYS